MKAILLAAGEGTRLKPLTETTPKCLLPVGGRPLLSIWFDMLYRCGVREVLINTHHMSDRVTDYIHTQKSFLKVHTTFEPELLGSAGTVRFNRDFVENESYFGIVYLDSLTTIDLKVLFRFHIEKSALLTLALFHTDVPERCGIVTVDEDGRIDSFIEKPENPHGVLSNTGIMVASPYLIDEIPDHYPSDFSYDVLPKLVGRMYGKVFDDVFIDIGTHESYMYAQSIWADIRGAFVEPIGVQSSRPV